MRPRIVIRPNSPYLPLFQRGGTRYKVILSGRGARKSFTVSGALLDRTYDDDGTILFTRYTLVNAEVSILPEFTDKIDRLRVSRDFVQRGNDLYNTVTGGKILFRGIKTSSGINTAALKSIPKLKLWVNDESEELVDEEVFDTIDLSIRYIGKYKDPATKKVTDVPGEVWLVGNSPDINHFLYRKFYKERGIEDVWNGVKDDVTYIWTTYLTNSHLPPEYIALAEKCKALDLEKYNKVWLGHFAMHKEGLIYKGWMPADDTMWPTHLRCWYGVDWGWNDPTAIVRCTYDPETGIVWLKELCYRGEVSTEGIARIIKEDIYNRRRTLTVGGRTLVWENGILSYNDEALPLGDLENALQEREFVGWQATSVIEFVEGIRRYDGEIYCDPSRPEQVRSLKIDFGLWAISADNRDKFGRIQYIRYFDVCYIGENIGEEQEGYRWKVDPKDKTKYMDEPQEFDDHLMDACNYAITNHLRKIGIKNKLGEQ